ncbi:MAG TPA: sulfatase-like hydrolase/transferase [bacterium]|nr:sulfatase-like hydrolase/transferase [bacterium]
MNNQPLSFKSAWWRFSGAIGVPFLIWICVDFLYRSSNINVFWDGLLSFLLLQLIFFGVALALGLLAASIYALLRWKTFERLVHIASVWVLFVVLMLYAKAWVMALLYSDEHAAFPIGNRVVVLGTTAFMGLCCLTLIHPGLRTGIAAAWDRGLGRLRALHAALAVAALLTLAGSLSLSKLNAHPKAAHPGENPARAKNALLLVIDTLSANHLSTYGNAGVPTPAFDRLSKSGYFFRDGRTNVTCTGPSISSILTGKTPMESKVLGFLAIPGPVSDENLATFLEDQGYRTESIVQNRYASFHHHGLPLPTNGESLLNFYEMTNRINRAFAAMGRKLGFAMKFQIDQLVPTQSIPFSSAFSYIAEHMKKFRGSETPFFLFSHIYLPTGIVYEPGVAPSVREYPGHYGPEMKSRVESAEKSYDKAVQDLDRGLGDFLDFLSKEGFLKDTAVIITADHGETFERGFWGHGDDLSEDSIKVPLFVLLPTDAREEVSEPVQSCGIAPTILSALGFEKPAWMDCADLLSRKPGAQVTFNFLSKSSVRKVVPYPGFSTGRSISLYEEPFKLIQRPNPGDQELYDLSNDLKEEKNLARSLPDKAQEMQSKLNALLFPSH